MHLRVFTEPQQGADYETLLQVARATEELGFDAFFRSDHFLSIGEGDGWPGPTDAWVTLAGLARETSRIKLGTLMTSATFRNPGLLAITVATVDVMSLGRVELGLGAGWFQAEHEAYGIEFAGVGERFDRLDEQLAIVTGLWDTPVGQTFSHHGAYYRLTGSPALPKPYAGRPRILVGGSGPRRTPDLAVRYADEFNIGFRTVDRSAAIIDNVRAVYAASGRTTELAYSVAQTVCCGRDEAEVARRAAAIGRDVADLRTDGLAGTPSEIVEKIGRFAEMGCSTVYLQVLDLHDLDHLELIAAEVQRQVGAPGAASAG